MRQPQTPQAQREQRSMLTHVTFQTLDDGSVAIIATGRNGALSLVVGGGANGPSMGLVDLEHPAPGRGYKGAWALKANGHLEGWLVDDKGEYTWIPERAKPRKLPAKGRKVTKSVRKEG